MPNSKRQVLKKVVRAVLGLLGVLVILSALLLGRLFSSPIQLNKLTPAIQKAVSNLPGGFHIELEGIELFWNRPEKNIQLRATNVALADQGGAPIVAAPAINLSISVPALMSRVIAVSAIELRGVSIHLLRKKDGSLQIGKKTAKVATGTSKPDKTRDFPEEFHDLTEIIAHLFSVLESSPDPRQPLSYLKLISLEGDFTAEDRKLDVDWRSNDIDFSFRGQEDGIAGELSLSIDSPEALSGVNFEISLLARGKDITANMKVSGVRPSRLAGLSKRLEFLEGVDLTLSGSVSGAMTLPDTINSLELEVAGGTGSISLDRYFPDPLLIRTLELKAKADSSARSLDLSNLNLSLGADDSTALNLHASGVAQSVDDGITVDLEVDLEHFAINNLATYWPAGLVTGARTWLTENLKIGEIDHASLSMGITLPTGDNPKISLAKLEGKITWSDLSVFFFRPLPPATGVSGTGTFNRHGFDLAVESGMVEGIAVNAGSVQITGLDTGPLALEFKTTLEGGVEDVLAVLELPPFELKKVIGFGSAEAGGHMTADFGIELPLKSGLTPAEIEYQVDARLTHASVQNIFRNYSVENATLELHNDSNRLAIKGSLEFAGIPITLDWNSNRVESGAVETEIKAAAAEITAIDVARLGYPVEDFFTGSFSAAVDTTLGSGGAIDASLVVDLSRSGLSIPMLRWSKQPGVKGKAEVSIGVAAGGLVNITDFSLDAGTLTASGEAVFDPETSELTLELDSAGLGNSFLNGLRLSRGPERGTRVSVVGGQVDLEPFLSPATGAHDDRNDGSADTDRTDEENADPGVFQIDVAGLEKVFFGPQRHLEDVSIELKHDGAGWQFIRVSGRNSFSPENPPALGSGDDENRLSAGQFIVRFGPAANGEYPLSIEVEDLGALMSTTLDNHDLNGGYLTIRGKSADALLKAPIDVSLNLDEFTLINVPLVAQVLSFASLKQLVDTMNSEGLVIDSFFGDLTLFDKKISTELLRAHGDSVGMTIGGSMDFAHGDLDLKGGVIPLYRISNVLGKIPLLKHVVVGDDGKGIIALDYTITGTIGKPEITVNPGSLLTPGALRHIFDHSETEQ